MVAKPIQPTRRGEFWAGFRDTFPLVVGAIPFALIFGAGAVTNGISPGGAQAMSLFVFAGSAQFIASQLVGSGVGVVIIVLTTFVVNLRHALYSATLAPYLKHLPQRWLAPLGFWLTDETFVIVIARYHQPDDSPYRHWYFLGSEVFMYVNWNVCTLLGIIAGQRIPNLADLGLGFAMTVTFIGMLIPQLKNRALLASAIVAAVTAVIAYPLPNKLYLIVAAVAGIAAGVLVESLSPAEKVKPLREMESAGGAHD
jgi:4-azaleucine resistance transporter AzlC